MTNMIEAPWAKIPLHVASDDTLTLGDIRTYIALDYLAGKRGHWYGSLEQIAAAAGVSRPTAARAIDALRDRQYVSTEKMGLEKRNVLRYFIHARTVAASTVITGDNEPVSPAITTAVITDDLGKDIDLPQTQSIETTTTTTAREFFLEVFSWHPNKLLSGELDGIDLAHPPGCVEWVFKRAAGMEDVTWMYARAMFNSCLLEGHGPREKQHGTNGVGNRASGAGGRRTQSAQPRSGPDMAGWERVLRNE